MNKDKPPVTPALRLLRASKVDFSVHIYTYEERGGTTVSARELSVPEHAVVKTLVMEDDNGKPFLVLMHGDREVSTKELARLIGARSIRPCTPEVANRHTGYLVGGTSPFATKKLLPVYIEKTILTLDKIYINGGKRGFLVGLAPKDVAALLRPTPVEVGIIKG